MCFPVTIKLKPEYHNNPDGINKFVAALAAYTSGKGRSIDYVLYMEHPTTNTHFHGIINYGFEKDKINFRRWLNRYYGFYYESPKRQDVDVCGWIKYMRKATEPGDNTIYQFN